MPCVSGGEGGADGLLLREGLHEVGAGRAGGAVGPAAVRHRVQPGQLHDIPAVAPPTVCWHSRTWSEPRRPPPPNSLIANGYTCPRAMNKLNQNRNSICI